MFFPCCCNVMQYLKLYYPIFVHFRAIYPIEIILPFSQLKTPWKPFLPFSSSIRYYAAVGFIIKLIQIDLNIWEYCGIVVFFISSLHRHWIVDTVYCNKSRNVYVYHISAESHSDSIYNLLYFKYLMSASYVFIIELRYVK